MPPKMNDWLNVGRTFTAMTASNENQKRYADENRRAEERLGMQQQKFALGQEQQSQEMQRVAEIEKGTATLLNGGDISNLSPSRQIAATANAGALLKNKSGLRKQEFAQQFEAVRPRIMQFSTMLQTDPHSKQTRAFGLGLATAIPDGLTWEMNKDGVPTTTDKDGNVQPHPNLTPDILMEHINSFAQPETFFKNQTELSNKRSASNLKVLNGKMPKYTGKNGEEGHTAVLADPFTGKPERVYFLGVKKVTPDEWTAAGMKPDGGDDVSETIRWNNQTLKRSEARSTLKALGNNIFEKGSGSMDFLVALTAPRAVGESIDLSSLDTQKAGSLKSQAEEMAKAGNPDAKNFLSLFNAIFGGGGVKSRGIGTTGNYDANARMDYLGL